MSSLESVALSYQASSAQRTAGPGRAIGVMFLSFFGTLWLILGCQNMPGVTWRLLALVGTVGAGIFLAGLSLSFRDAAAGSRSSETDSASDSEQAKRRRVFRNVNVIQWCAIGAWIVLLNVVGHVEWITPGIMFIVGVHFFPLASLFNDRANAVTGAVLTLLALVYPFVATGGPASAIGPVCAGIVLWLGALAKLVEVARRR